MRPPGNSKMLHHKVHCKRAVIVGGIQETVNRLSAESTEAAGKCMHDRYVTGGPYGGSDCRLLVLSVKIKIYNCDFKCNFVPSFILNILYSRDTQLTFTTSRLERRFFVARFLLGVFLFMVTAPKSIFFWPKCVWKTWHLFVTNFVTW